MLTQFKQKMVAAKKGHSLLKKKSDALTMRFRAILGQIVETKEAMGTQMKSASFSLAEATYAAGDIRPMVTDNVGGSAAAKVRMRLDNVAGVKLPVFEGNFQKQVCRQRGPARAPHRFADDRAVVTSL